MLRTAIENTAKEKKLIFLIFWQYSEAENLPNYGAQQRRTRLIMECNDNTGGWQAFMILLIATPITQID